MHFKTTQSLFSIFFSFIAVSAQSNTTSKAGLAWPNGNSVDIRQYTRSGKVSWYYSWSSWPTRTDLEFVPMLWGPSHVDEFANSIDRTIRNNRVTSVLGMNEPQQAGQANISPEDGVALWLAHLEPLHARGIRLGSPAPSSAPSGKTWLTSFLDVCAGRCTVDFIVLHWYGINATQFINYVIDFHETFQRPIWVTEWACHNFVDLNVQCSSEDVAAFLNETQSFMDNATFVERYSWFGAMRDMQDVNQANSLMDRNGRINALGMQYIGLQGQAILSNSGRSCYTVYTFPPIIFLILIILW